MNPPAPPRPSDGPAIEVEPLKYRAGDVIADKYRLEELMGQGGMGSVWRATNTALSVDVAVKLVHGDLASPEMTARLKREAHAAAKLEHPSAVRVFDLGETELGDPFIVMELLRGESLRDLYEREKILPATRLVPLLLPIASALAAAHQKGIVHRDLKPENVVLVESEGRTVPKVVDFGLAKVESPDFDRKSTREGTILGSPDYMSPEQARGAVDRMDARTDVWALGVVLYEGLAGSVPFSADHPLALLRAIIEDPAPSLVGAGKADAKLSAIVDKALAKSADDRFLDMRAFGRALADWAVGQGLDTDVTGASIAALWMRESRASMTSQVEPLPVAKDTSEVGRDLEAAPTRRSEGTVPLAYTSKRSGSSRWLVVVVGALALGVGIAAAVGIAKRRVSAEPPGPRAAASGAPTAGASGALAIRPSSARPGPRPAAPSASVPSSTPVASSAPSVPPSASTGPAAEDPGACVAKLFGADALEVDSTVGQLCEERDPRRGAQLFRTEIARHGLLAGRTTAAMQEWALLSWYELAVFAFARGACCPTQGLAKLDVPPDVGTCPPLGPALEELQRDAKLGVADRAVADFRSAVLCVDRGHRANAGIPIAYSYEGAPGGGAESAFRRIMARAY